MKKTTLLVGAFLCAICSFAQGEYPINWDKDANITFTRGDRQTSSVSITVNGEQQTIDVMSKSSVTYRDFSDQTFTVQPGDEIVPSIAYGGEWMHGYVYLDTNNNGAFDVNGYEDQNDELVAFSFYSPTDASSGVNGIGQTKSNNCNVNPMNAFTAPEKPGQYRMRYIVDWNCIDPAGQYGSNYSSNFINANGGVIVDVTLVVEGEVEPELPAYNTTIKFFTAPELRAEADATGKALIGIAGVTTTANKYINGKAYNGVLASEEGTLEGLRAPQEDEVLEVIVTEGGYLLRQADAAEGEGYLKCAAGGNFTTSVAADANVWTILGPGEDGYGDITGWDDLYSDIDKSYNENMVRFISNGQYLNGQNRDGVGGLRGGKGAWSFNYIYNANYAESVEPVDPVDPVDPEPPVVEPEELTWSPVEAGGVYAIVNLQPTENDFYLDYLDGNLSTVPAGECNSLFEWPETAKFLAIELADGRFAFKNCGTGNYLAWKGTANRNNTTGAYNNCGYNPEINEMSSWTMNESTRFDGGYWFRAEQRNEIPNDGANLTGTFVIGNDGAWNAWTDGECTMATFSNTFGFYLIEKGETPDVPEPPVVEPDRSEELAAAVAEANTALEGHDNVWVVTVGDKLITRNNQFSSPHSDRAEGSTNNLLDGAANTFWHSDWHAGNQAAHSHYLEVALDEAIDGDVLLTFVRRNAANDQVTLLDVETSMDGENFAHAAYIDMPNSGAGQTEQKVFALEEKAKFLRFWADATTSNRGYWHVGDFQLQTVSTDLNADAPDYAYPDAVAALQEAIAAAQQVEKPVQADVDALVAAIEAYKAALAGYPEFTEWTGEVQVNAGEVKTIDDLLDVDFCFNRALTAEASAFGVLGVVFDHSGDAYALAFDALFGGVEVEKVKAEGFVGNVAHVHFDKIDDLSSGLQDKAKSIAAKIGGFQASEGHALVVLSGKSFLVDGEQYNAIVTVDYEFGTGNLTGIKNLLVNSKGEIFDLQGRRVNAAQNGLFILNGKKVIR